MLKDTIRNHRETNHLTQTELADQLHVTRQTVSEWERGLSVPNADQVLELAKIFHATTDELLEYTKEEVEQKNAITEQIQKEYVNLKVPKNEILYFTITCIIAVIIGFFLASAAFSSNIFRYGEEYQIAFTFEFILSEFMKSPEVLIEMFFVSAVFVTYEMYQFKKGSIGYLKRRVRKEWKVLLLIVIVLLQIYVAGYYFDSVKHFNVIFLPMSIFFLTMDFIPLCYLSYLLS